MRFSDIQDNPLKYNLNALLKELKNYFTVYVHRYPFISYIDNDQLTLFSFYIDEDSRKYSRKKLLNEIEQELTAFENSIKAFDN